MSTTKTKTPQGIRYTDAQKKEVVDFVLSTNAALGRGGVSKATTKFNISPITVNSWLKAAGATSAPAAKPAPAAKAAPAPKAAAKAAPAVKAAPAAKAPVAKKAAAQSKAGTRYTAEQKKEVTDFVASFNAANGRGGQSTAAAKFGISPLTVMAWLKSSGAPKAAKKAAKKAGKKAVAPAATPAAAPKAAPSVAVGDIASKLTALLDLTKEIAKSEVALAQLKAKFVSIKASL